MHRFKNFYESLSDAIVPILVVCTVGIVGWILKAASGSGITDSDISVVLFTAAVAISTIVLWAVCTVIRAYQLDKVRRHRSRR